MSNDMLTQASDGVLRSIQDFFLKRQVSRIELRVGFLVLIPIFRASR